VFVPDSLKKQSEIIRALTKQLEAKERELADQKWLLQLYLQSPSWRLTAPVRWIARQLRAFRRLFGSAKPVIESAPAPVSDSTPASPDTIDERFALEVKELLTSHCRVALESLLTSQVRVSLPHSSTPLISVIIVLFNRAELTLACLRSLAEDNADRMEIIIVDNASTDDTHRLLNKLDGARVIQNPSNHHFLRAVNRAAREARGDYLLLLNNDAQLMPGALQSALETLRGQEDIGAVGGKIILLDGTLQEAGSIVWNDGSCLGYGRGDNPFAPGYMFRRDVDYCSGAFLLTPRSIWESLGGFDEIFTPAYYEETDYCMRLWEKGMRVVYDPDAVVLHYEFASSPSSADAIKTQREHQAIFAKRHAALLQKHFRPDPDSILKARVHDKRQRRTLFLDDRVPHPWLGSGFPRARTLLATLLSQGFFVTFYPLTHFDEDWQTVYCDMPRELEVMCGMGPSLLEAFLRDRQRYYDSIIVSRPHNMQLLQPILASYPEWFENVNVIYDAEALFAGRDIGMRRLRGDAPTAEEEQKLISDEIGLARSATCVIAVSEQDRAAFERCGIDRAYLLGHFLPPNPTPNAFHHRAGFLFVGAVHEEASPNGDSLIWFLEEILPRIRSVLGRTVPVTVAGLNKSERILRLADENIRMMGHVSSLAPFYNQARVFVAPTRYAAGIPHKVHEACAFGVPVVATPLLADQLRWADGIDLLAGGDANTFAQHCIALHNDSRLWSRLRERGLENIRRECSAEVFEGRLSEIMAAERKRFADVGLDG
jgi:GT2 family glycosyltransferase